jgi:hypothetical protein
VVTWRAAKPVGSVPSAAISSAIGGAIGWPTTAAVPAEETLRSAATSRVSNRSAAGDRQMLPVHTHKISGD